MDDDAPGSIVLLGEIVFVHQNHPTQELIHYNFSAEWAIQSFMLALCMLFTDGTYEAHLAVIISHIPKWKSEGDFLEVAAQQTAILDF